MKKKEVIFYDGGAMGPPDDCPKYLAYLKKISKL